MKLLTINTHSLVEPDYDKKLEIFTDALYRIRPDIIAMQEVNQTERALVEELGREFDVRRDNHALCVCNALKNKGLDYKYFWLGIKSAYGIFQEGIAIITSMPVDVTDCVLISNTDDITNWKTRKALGVKVGKQWFYSIHTGRCDDTDDPFSAQWRRFREHVLDKDNVWVMGDFNCDAESDGYYEVINSGWHDTFALADERDSGVTVPGKIDGWRDTDVSAMRIDYIFTNRKRKIKKSQIVFNGINEKVVSDHYGILVEAE